MAQTKYKTVVGVFQSRERAQQAVNELKQEGFRDDQIGVVARNGEGNREVSDGDGDGESYAGEGAVTGIATGAGVGALWGLGIIAGVLPILGPAIAGGALAAILTSAAAGAAAAGLAGALIGMGIPKDEAEYYEEEFKAGRTLVTVSAEGRESQATAILRRLGGYDISSRSEAGAQSVGQSPLGTHSHSQSAMGASTTPGAFSQNELRVPIREEQVKVEKTPRDIR